jgi:hypothetical protein
MAVSFLLLVRYKHKLSTIACLALTAINRCEVFGGEWCDDQSAEILKNRHQIGLPTV